jgi:hypothetical protein
MFSSIFFTFAIPQGFTAESRRFGPDIVHNHNASLAQPPLELPDNGFDCVVSLQQS